MPLWPSAVLVKTRNAALPRITLPPWQPQGSEFNHDDLSPDTQDSMGARGILHHLTTASDFLFDIFFSLCFSFVSFWFHAEYFFFHITSFVFERLLLSFQLLPPLCSSLCYAYLFVFFVLMLAFYWKLWYHVTV